MSRRPLSFPISPTHADFPSFCLDPPSVFAFLTLFISQYTKYAKNDFHISGESYAGTYLPNIASVINRNTQALTGLGELAPLPKLNFKSVLIGNGLTDPKVQFGTGVYDYACKVSVVPPVPASSQHHTPSDAPCPSSLQSPYAVFEQDGPECANLKAKGPSCAKLIDNCYKSGSRFACVPAALYCWTQMYGDFNKLGLNPYDVRKTCDKAPEKDGPLCYPQMGWVEEYLYVYLHISISRVPSSWTRSYLPPVLLPLSSLLRTGTDPTSKPSSASPPRASLHHATCRSTRRSCSRVTACTTLPRSSLISSLPASECSSTPERQT